jgi:ectoine hydroxylase-related dioxygenase (phytanoyl-CoA dioxygenase family)
VHRKPEADDNGFKDFDGAKGERFLESSVAFSTLAIDPYITSLASYYWGKPIRLAYAHGYRLEPVSEREYRAFQWHHDLKRKQIKVMVLLTDVPANGQRMDYIPGSHVIWHRFTNHRDVRFTRDQALQFGEPIPCHGPAGTVVVFDTNGIHRGNRNPGPRRDQYTFNYTAGKALFTIPGIHPQVRSAMDRRQGLLVRSKIHSETYPFTRHFRYFHDWLLERFFIPDNSVHSPGPLLYESTNLPAFSEDRNTHGAHEQINHEKL